MSGAHQQLLHLNHKPLPNMHTAEMGSEDKLKQTAQKPFNVHAITYV